MTSTPGRGPASAAPASSKFKTSSARGSRNLPEGAASQSTRFTTIKVFFEETGEGARWHVNLAEYRKLAHGEHGNPAALVLWALHGISIAFFIYGLSLIRPWLWHYAMSLPLVGLMIYEHCKFAGNRQSIEDAWHLVRDPIRAALPPEPQSEKSVRP